MAGSVGVGLRGTLQVPLRGPAQPLAAVRSDACEAVPRKQCALTPVSSVAASMRLRAPQPHPHRPPSVGRGPRRSQGRGSKSKSNSKSNGSRATLGSTGSRLGFCRAMLGTPLQKTANSPLFPCAPTQCPRDGGYGFMGPSTAWVRRMRRTGWAGRPAPALPSAQDCALAQAVAEPTWVRAHCLRGIASHAPERTAASGWAGPRSGTCGVSREPIPAVAPRQTQVPPCFEL